MLSICSRGPS